MKGECSRFSLGDSAVDMEAIALEDGACERIPKAGGLRGKCSVSGGRGHWSLCSVHLAWLDFFPFCEPVNL